MEQEIYYIIKTKLLPIFSKRSVRYRYRGFCHALICLKYDYDKIEIILDFIKKYGQFTPKRRSYWFQPGDYKPRKELLEKALNNYKNYIMFTTEYANYNYVKTIIYPEFKKIFGFKYPGICSFLRNNYCLSNKEINPLIEFIIHYGKYTGWYCENDYLYQPFEYNPRRKLIKKAIKNYEKENYI